MSRNSKVTQQIEVIIKVLSLMEHGGSIEEIKVASGLDIELRTLQRRLADLKKLGLVKTSGDKRSTRYHYTVPRVERSGADFENTTKGMSILPLSEEGQEIRSLVLLPEPRRKPVGYNREFLERYRPNIDSYLKSGEKQKLGEVGKTLREDQPAGTYVKEILHRLLIDLSWNSSRLEGNTYSLLDTERLIVQGKAASNKSARDAQMILNHKDAIEFIVQGTDGIGLNRYTILNLHALLSNNLLPDPAASGRLRTFAVGISKSVYTPLAMPQLIEAMFERILEKADQIQNPFEQAFFLMVHIPYLQPFDDVNKRVSRLAANIPLNRNNISPLSFTDVPSDLYTQGMLGIYELNRIELLKDIFLWAYERSSLKYAAVRQSLGEPDPFRLKYREQMRTLITEIISKTLGREESVALMNDRALQLPSNDRTKFIETVETELMSLHEGNFARYWVTPAEFRSWKNVWDISD
ncbi:Fic family protein [Niastella populi]|uniref:Cell filamentation protein Fic n=1 Tax=Niastella populi TaxID=550983 RepID=A0A1V9GAG2_9BACT|nr:Fic family protein [Niastella populi]OQP67649.1 cell filamentation protein Fic [Niastella populi]